VHTTNPYRRIKTFYDIQQSELLDVAKDIIAIFYDRYNNVVQRLTANYDNCHPSRIRNEVQWVNSTKLRLDFDDEDFNDPDHYNDDLDDTIVNFDSFSIHEARHGKYLRRPSIRCNVWSSLSTEAQFARDKHSDRGKLAIMFGSKQWKQG